MSSLFSGRIPKLVGATDGAIIQVPNGSDARWARDTSGRTWVRKHEADTGIQPLVAEVICHLLGRELGVRQPDAALLRNSEGWSWMSRAVEDVSEHWSADHRDMIANLDEVGRMLALDAITANGDRHRRNLLLVPEEDGRFTVWAIDSGNALIGWKSDYLELDLALPSVRNHARGLPIEPLRMFALEGAIAATVLPRDLIVESVAEAYRLVGDEEHAAISDALVRRCRHAAALVSAYLDALESLQ